MFTLTVFLVQSALVAQIRGSAPPGMPNVFLLDIPGPQRQAVSRLASGSSPASKQAPDVAVAVAARITAIDGTPIDNLPLRDFGRRFLRTRSVTEMDAKPPDTAILSGAWWRPGDRDPQVCVNEEAAQILNLQAGHADRLEHLESHRAHARGVHRAHRIHPHDGALRVHLQPGPTGEFPGGLLRQRARAARRTWPALQRVLYQKFPTVTVVNVADVMQIVEDVVERIALVIRFISAFTILAGAVMVASSVAGTRFRRMREVVILKTLGATRRRIAWIFSVEFLALGAVAGLMGSLLAAGFAALGAQTPAGDRLPPGTGDAARSRWHWLRLWRRWPDGPPVSAFWAGSRWKSCATNRRRSATIAENGEP